MFCNKSQATKCFNNHNTAIQCVLNYHCQMWGVMLVWFKAHTPHLVQSSNQFPHVSHVHICIYECFATSLKLSSTLITTPLLFNVFWITTAKYGGGVLIWFKVQKPHLVQRYSLVTSFCMFPMYIYVYMSVL